MTETRTGELNVPTDKPVYQPTTLECWVVVRSNGDICVRDFYHHEDSANTCCAQANRVAGIEVNDYRVARVRVTIEEVTE